MATSDIEHLVEIPIDGVIIKGIVRIPSKAQGLVLIAHATTSYIDNLSTTYIADRLQQAGLGTLVIDLLTPVEAAYPQSCFDIKLLTERLEAATSWLAAKPRTRSLSLGYLTEGSGTAAALYAAAALKPAIKAIVSCSGRPDLAMAALPQVDAPTLFIAGDEDEAIARINQRTSHLLAGDVDVQVIPGAADLFREPVIEEVTRLARSWFRHHLRAKRARTTIHRKSN